VVKTAKREWELAIEAMKGKLPQAAIKTLERLCSIKLNYENVLFELKNYWDVHFFLKEDFIIQILERLGYQTVKWYVKRGVHLHKRMRVYALLDFLEVHAMFEAITILLRELDAYRGWSAGEKAMLYCMCNEICSSIGRRKPEVAARHVVAVIEKWVKVHRLSLYDAKIGGLLAAKLWMLLRENPLPVADAMTLGLDAKLSRLSIKHSSGIRSLLLEEVLEEEGKAAGSSDSGQGSREREVGEGGGERETGVREVEVGRGAAEVSLLLYEAEKRARRMDVLANEWKKQIESKGQQP